MWTLAVQNSDELIYIWSFKPLEKRMTSKDIFPVLSMSLSFNFHDQSDFPGLSKSWNFEEKIQDFPGGMETLAKIWVKSQYH